MKQIVDKNGVQIKGLFRKDDGSIAVRDKLAFQKHELVQHNINNLNDEVTNLKRQMAEIMSLLQQKG